MTMTMIERVARAICAADPTAPEPDATIMLGMKSARAWEARVPMARAAIAETREPTAKMRAALLARMDNPTVQNPKAAAWDALLGHYAMIDEALREG